MENLQLVINRHPSFPYLYEGLSLLPGRTRTFLKATENGDKYEAILVIGPEDLRTITDWLTARVAELDELGVLPPRKEPNHEAA